MACTWSLAEIRMPVMVNLEPTSNWFWVLVAAVVGTVIWMMLDASARGEKPWLVGMLGLLVWPFSILLWLAGRPKRVPKAAQGPASVSFHTCPREGCGQPAFTRAKLNHGTLYECLAGHTFSEPDAEE